MQGWGEAELRGYMNCTGDGRGGKGRNGKVRVQNSVLSLSARKVSEKGRMEK